MNNLDRILGILCVFLILFCVAIIFVNFSFSWSWFLFVLWTMGLGIWTINGLKKLDVGWKGQFLFLGQRTSYFVEEGWHWAPFPYEIKLADCRQQIKKLDQLEVFTQDNMKVKVDGSLVSQIVNLNLYFGVNEKDTQQGLDDRWDEIIRSIIIKFPLKKVLGMHIEAGNKAQEDLQIKASKWGINVIDVLVPAILPDPKTIEDLALVERENLQREGQEVEIKHFTTQVNTLMLPPPKGAGLSLQQAVEHVQMAIGKATKAIDAKTITLDTTTTGLVAEFLKGRKP